MDDKLSTHLELIQAVVARQAGNSFLLKGWSVTLAAGLLALGASRSSAAFSLIGLFPAVALWGLDAYYLRQERLFRALYDDVIAQSAGEASHVKPFSMDTASYRGSVACWLETLFSRSVFPLHAVVVAVITLVSMILLLANVIGPMTVR